MALETASTKKQAQQNQGLHNKRIQTSRELEEQRSEIPVINVAFVGGGKGCRDVLRLLTTYPMRNLRLKVLGVADPRKEAPGRIFAEELGIMTTDDYRDLFKFSELDLIIELTGSDDVLEEILANRPKGVKVMDHLGARLLWEIIEIQEEKLILEERLNASEKMIAVGEMVYRLTHELRNPLMCIGGLTRRIILDPETSHYVRKQMEKIVSYVEQMEKAVSNICDMAKPIRPHFSVTDIVSTLKTWCKGLRYEARRYNVKVKCVIEDSLPKLTIDKGLIAQVLWHVVEYAMEGLTQKGGGSILIQARLCWDEVLIVIEQNGTPVECNEESEDKLVTSDEAVMLPAKRSSLWLAICRKIMYDHGGDIRVETRNGKLIVILELPIRFDAPEDPLI